MKIFQKRHPEFFLIQSFFIYRENIKTPSWVFFLEPTVGLEPTTDRLQGDCSTN